MLSFFCFAVCHFCCFVCFVVVSFLFGLALLLPCVPFVWFGFPEAWQVSFCILLLRVRFLPCLSLAIVVVCVLLFLFVLVRPPLV